MRLPKCLLLMGLFAAVFSCIVSLESKLSSPVLQAEDLIKKAYKKTEEMKFAANFDFQIQTWFGKLRELVNKDSDSFFSSKVEPGFLRKYLPPHTLAVAEADENGKMLRFINLSGDMKEELCRSFIALSAMYKIHFSNSKMRERNSSIFDKSDKGLREFLGVDSARVSTIMLRSSRMSIFNDSNSSICFYWDRFKKSDGKTIFFFSKIERSQVSDRYAYRSYLSSSSSAGFHCGYFDEKNNSFMGKRDFKENVSLSDLKVIARECIKKEQIQAGLRVSKISRLHLKSQIAIVGRYIGRSGLRPVVIISVPRTKGSSLTSKRSVVTMICICLMMLFVVNSSVFSRGPSMNVGTVLMLAMIFAILMPFMMGRSVFKLILQESFEKERLKIERDVHQSLIGIDSSFRTVQQNLQQRIGQILKEPEVLQTLVSEESQTEVEEIEKSVLLEVALRTFRKVAQGYESVPKKFRTMNAFILSGPGGYLRYFNKYRGNVTFSKETLKNLEAMYLLLNLFKKQLFEYYPKEMFEPDFYNQYNLESRNKVEAIKFEEIRMRLRKSMGQDRFHDVMNQRGVIHSVRTSFGQTMFSSFPIIVGGEIRYFAGYAWDEFAISPVFLRRAFALRKKADEILINSSTDSFFRKLDPVSRVKRKPLTIMAYDGFRFDTFSSLDSEEEEKQSEQHATLGNLLKNTFRSKQLVKFETAGEKASIFEVYPAKNFTVYLIGARQDISHLKKIENIRSTMFISGMAIFLLFSLLAAKNISGSFTNPLQHLLWGLNKVKENDYTIRLKDAREDEFGSISRAFNAMVRRLREKDVLGKFVSDSVKRLAADPELMKKACEGAEEDVTILFASLEGFANIALNASEEEAQKYFEFSLSRFFCRAEEFGGEVDKVIGEKLLIIFPHRKMGRMKAIESAIALAEGILKDFAAEKALKPVFGINTGQVISGIIGAPSVRMDFTVIGDPVNVAARLCAVATSGSRPIIISGLIKEILGDSINVEKIDMDKIRGKRQEVEVFKLII